jgi:sigma-E factor negative regulatory protein RseB
MCERAGGRRAGHSTAFLLAVAALAFVPAAWADDAAGWLARAANAAKQLNYAGTLVYQHGGRIETSRLVHMNANGAEYEKLVNLEGPPREVIRRDDEVRCYYPDAKVVRIEPRTFRNAFPSLSPQQQKALSELYEFRKAETGRVAGLQTQAWVFEPKDGLRYGHKFWAEVATGLPVKARVIDERGQVLEQVMFTELTIGARIDPEMVKPTWPVTPPDWQVRQSGPADADARETGWTVERLPAGFAKVAEGYRTFRGMRRTVAHLVYSDGLVAVSIFIEPVGEGPPPPYPPGLNQQGGLNVLVRQQEGNLITVLGEVPVATIRQISSSVARRQ